MYHLGMEITYIINMLVLSIAVSLGVGCSTVAIAQFFGAIKDGEIDPAERRMMGVVYFLLRVAMGAILVTLFIQAAIIYHITGDFLYISPYFQALYTAVAVLFLNAVGMTMKYIPSSIGPALQATSWYTIGILTALVSLNLAGFAYTEFLLLYAGAFILVAAGINIAMKQLKSRKV
jgi:hypothetical protein